jgi:hypothetical protein
MRRREFMKLVGAVGAGLLGVGDIKAAAPVVGKGWKVTHGYSTGFNSLKPAPDGEIDYPREHPQYWALTNPKWWKTPVER